MPSAPKSLLFKDFLLGVKGKDFVPPKYMIALDPGETTGYAEFRNGELVKVSQLITKTVKQFTEVLSVILSREDYPDMIVYEDYRIYSWKSEHHAWQALHTPQAIGALKALATLKCIPLYTNLAQQPKAFCTDDKLKMWGYYSTQRHGRDAVRHGTYYLLFNYVADDQKHFNGNLDPIDQKK